MKSKKICALLVLALVVANAGCGRKKQETVEQPADTPVITEEVTEAPTETPAPTDTPEATEVAEESENDKGLEAQSTPDVTPVEDQLHIYYGDSNAEHIIYTGIKKQKVTPELLLGELVKHDVVTKETKVNSIKESSSSKGKTLAVDFSGAFQEAIFNQGSSGEFIMIGSVVNTFLEAYGADSMTITVEGNTLESGHCIYDSPMKFYEVEKNASAQDVSNGIAKALGVD